MIRFVFMAVASLLIVFSGFVYGARRTLYQMVDTYVCEDDVAMAEIAAKAKVTRKQLLTVSYCTCEGVARGMRSTVANITCGPPKDTVFSCSCIGKNSY